MWRKTAARSSETVAARRRLSGRRDAGATDELRRQLNRPRDVLLLPRPIRMIRPGQPGDLDRRRELVAGDVAARPERIALPLNDQRRGPQRAEVLRPQLLR